MSAQEGRRIANVFASLYDDEPTQRNEPRGEVEETRNEAGHDDEEEEDEHDEDEYDEDEYDEDEDEDDPRQNPVKFLDIPGFSSAAPIGFPRIIDEKEFDEESDRRQITLADGIATFLNCWDVDGKHRALEKFFGLYKEASQYKREFRVKEYVVKSNAESMMELFLARTGSKVLAGLRNEDHEFENQVTYHITPEGRWVPLGTIWPYPRTMSKAEATERDGRLLTEAMLWNSMWSTSMFTVTTEEYS